MSKYLEGASGTERMGVWVFIYYLLYHFLNHVNILPIQKYFIKIKDNTGQEKYVDWVKQWAKDR